MKTVCNRQLSAKCIRVVEETRNPYVHSVCSVRLIKRVCVAGVHAIAWLAVVVMPVLGSVSGPVTSEEIESRFREVSIPELISGSDAVFGVRVISAALDYGGADRKFGCGVRYEVGVFSLIDDVPELYRDIYPRYVGDARTQKSLKLGSIGVSLNLGAEYIFFWGNKVKADRARAIIYPDHADVDRGAAEEFCNHHFPVDLVLTSHDRLTFSPEYSYYFGEPAILIPPSLGLGTNPPSLREVASEMQYESPDPTLPKRTVKQVLRYMLLKDFVKAYYPGRERKFEIPTNIRNNSDLYK